MSRRVPATRQAVEQIAAPADGATGGRAARAVTSGGRLSGQWEDGVAVFRGVPFAAPPVGESRWRPPRPPAAWDGERRAVEFGPAPLQPSPPRDSVMFHLNFDDRRPLVMSEDCLYLNVWSPDPSRSAALPVMVWVHGGGNRYGHGSQDIHNGARMAARGLVVVTLNYRLGALGFLAHPQLAAQDAVGASGNYALLDIVAALTWVRENIAAFGGDPAKVTLAGNSAGAAHVCHLMASPLAAGLFRFAIGQSAAGVGRAEGPMPDQRAAQDQGLRYAREFGDRDLAGLRRISGVELVVKGHFGPVVDGRVVPRDTGAVFRAGQQQPVPLMVGSNADEGVLYTPPTAAAALAARSAQLGTVYPTGDTDQARRSARLYTGESRFVYPVWHWARTHRATAPTWVYRFTHAPPLPSDVDIAAPPDGQPGFGAFHTAELPYTADNLATRRWPWTDADRALAAAMAGAWARFVETGDPNGGGLATWAELTASGDAPVLFFDTGGVESRPHDRLDAMRLLDALPRPL